MSYYSDGTILVLIGIPLLALGGIGIISIIMGIAFFVMAGAKERPGAHPGRCSKYGHDWRRDQTPMHPGVRCRNCLQIKGQPNTGVPMAPPLVLGPAYPSPYGAPVVAYYGAPPTPTATQRAAYAPPVQQYVCPSCGSPVQAGMAACPWCNRPF